MKKTIIAISAAISFGILFFVYSLPARAAESAVGYAPMIILYDEDGAVIDIKGFPLEESMAECKDTATKQEQLASMAGLPARVICVPILPSPLPSKGKVST